MNRRSIWIHNWLDPKRFVCIIMGAPQPYLYYVFLFLKIACTFANRPIARSYLTLKTVAPSKPKYCMLFTNIKPSSTEHNDATYVNEQQVSYRQLLMLQIDSKRVISESSKIYITHLKEIDSHITETVNGELFCWCTNTKGYHTMGKQHQCIYDESISGMETYYYSERRTRYVPFLYCYL